MNGMNMKMRCCILSTVAGCGVSFSESFEGTETFEDLQLTGERVPGGELTVSVSVRQGYPVPVKVGCYYENSDELTDDQKKVTFEDRALRIGETILQPAAGQEPDDDELPQQRLTFSFSVPARRSASSATAIAAKSPWTSAPYPVGTPSPYRSAGARLSRAKHKAHKP